MLYHRLYISIVSVDFIFDKLLYTYLISLQTEYPKDIDHWWRWWKYQCDV